MTHASRHSQTCIAFVIVLALANCGNFACVRVIEVPADGGTSDSGPSGGHTSDGDGSLDGGSSSGGSSGGGSSGGGSSGGSASAPPAPRSPTPSDGVRDVAVDFWARLDWAPVAHSYEVYFGTDPTPDSGEFLQTTNTSETDNWLNLQYDTTYYWQVVSLDGSKSTDGSVWSFRTESDPSGDGGSDGSQETDFEPGTYHGLVVQETDISSGGVLIDTDSRSSSQTITINAEGVLNYSVGDTVVRWGLTTEVTSISVSDSGDIIRMFYDAYGTIDGVSMSGSGSEFYTWLSSSESIVFSGSVSVHTTNQTPQLEQESRLHSTFVRF